MTNVSLLRSSGLQLFTPGQDYALEMRIDVPENDINYQIGNFLVGVEIFGSTPLSKQYHCTENVLLSYRSMLYSILRTFLLLPFLLIGYTDQRQTLTITFEKLFTESLVSVHNFLKKPFS